MKLDQSNIHAIVQGQRDRDNAFLSEMISGGQSEVITLTIDLGTARLETAPFELRYPFKSFYIYDGSDTAVSLNMKFNTRDSWQKGFPVRLRDSMTFPRQQQGAYLWWNAQVGKTISIALFVSGEFKTGNTITVSTTAVEATSLTTVTPVSVLGTATLILASDSSRKVVTLYNNGTSTVWLGTSGVTTTNGIPLLAGATCQIKNSGAIYGIASVAGQAINILTEA